MSVYIRLTIATPKLRVPTRLGPTTAYVTLGFQVTAHPAKVCYNCYWYDNAKGQIELQLKCLGFVLATSVALGEIQPYGVFTRQAPVRFTGSDIREK